MDSPSQWSWGEEAARGRETEERGGGGGGGGEQEESEGALTRMQMGWEGEGE